MPLRVACGIATDDVVSESFEQWRAVVSDSFVPLRIEAPPGPFRARIASVGRDGVQMSVIEADQHSVERTPRLARSSAAPFYKVSLQLIGSQLLTQDHREVLLRPGQFAIYDSTRPYTLASDAPFRSFVVMLPQEALEVPASAVAGVTGTQLSHLGGVSGLVGRIFEEVAANLKPVVAPAGARVVRSVVDLLGATLAEQLDLAAGVTEQQHRALALRIRYFIDARLADPDLTPDAIASAHFISTRYLQKLFRAENETVTGWIRARRLQRCRTDLADPLHAARPVSAIGARWGFLDAAHFSRAFKSVHGVSPGEYRAQMLSG